MGRRSWFPPAGCFTACPCSSGVGFPLDEQGEGGGFSGFGAVGIVVGTVYLHYPPPGAVDFWRAHILGSAIDASEKLKYSLYTNSVHIYPGGVHPIPSDLAMVSLPIGGIASNLLDVWDAANSFLQPVRSRAFRLVLHGVSCGFRSAHGALLLVTRIDVGCTLYAQLVIVNTVYSRQLTYQKTAALTVASRSCGGTLANVQNDGCRFVSGGAQVAMDLSLRSFGCMNNQASPLLHI